MTSSSPIGAHMSALLSLRNKSLQAYGINPKDLMIREERSLIELPEKQTQTLAKIARETRALAVQSEHHLTVV